MLVFFLLWDGFRGGEAVCKHPWFPGFPYVLSAFLAVRPQLFVLLASYLFSPDELSTGVPYRRVGQHEFYFPYQRSSLTGFPVSRVTLFFP